MRKVQKKQAEDFIRILGLAHEEIKRAIEKRRNDIVMELLAQCQDGVVKLGGMIEDIEGGEFASAFIPMLEEYCELAYQVYQEAAQDRLDCGSREYDSLQRSLRRINNSVEHDIQVRTEVVFLPYKASMWDSLESIWKAADEDPDCEAYVVPIPYYDKNPDGSFREKHYEGNQYPDYVPVIDYRDYDLAERHPDMVFIHNPYDEYNYVTSVEPFYYSNNLKKYTDLLVYIPYFILEEKESDTITRDSVAHFCTVPGVINADKVIVQSDDMRSMYIDVLAGYSGGTKMGRAYWEQKIDGIGSPKIDRILAINKENLIISDEWMDIIQKPDGSWKKIVFYNTGVSALLQHGEKMLEKMRRVFQTMKENREETALLWRPHPLIKATIISMRPKLWEAYSKLADQYRRDGWGIYDDSADLDRAVVLADMYYGDWSSVVSLVKKRGILVVIQNVRI